MSEAKPPRVFLSYSRPDRARVAKLAEALKVAGIDVWWDTAIEGGASFSADIERELDAADVVVVAWTASSVKSTWVLDEAGAGRDRGRLVPVQLDATPPPLGFRQFQAIDLSTWKGRAGDAKVAALVSAIHKLAGAEVAAPLAKAAPATTGPSRRVLIGGTAGVAALAASGFGVWKFMGQKADDGTASIVVLPFANLSGDPAQAFFSDGIAEELRNALSQIRGLKVIGRVSSEKFRDTDDLPAAAEKLGVDHVLTGSVRRSPTTIRIGAQLVEGKTGVESWSASYDQPIGDALAIQSKIATSVVAALSAKLGAAVGQVVVGGTRDVEAQALFLQAVSQYARGRTEASLRQVRVLMEAAIARDPGYSDAWAGLTISKFDLAPFAATAAEGAQLVEQGVMAVQRAVALAPQSGFALGLLADSALFMLDVRTAVINGRRAMALSPADARVMNCYVFILLCVDPDLAVDVARRAVALDPFNTAYLENLSSSLLSARQYDAAILMARKTLAMSNNQRGASILIMALLAMNSLDEMRASLKYLEYDGQRFSILAILEARAGNRPASDAALAALRKSEDLSINYRLAAVYAQRGEAAAALEALETALQHREWRLTQMAFDLRLDPIRREPRFKAVQDSVIPPDLFVRPKRWVA